MYFDLQAAIRKLNAEANAALGAERHPNGAEPPSGRATPARPTPRAAAARRRAAAGRLRASERWADAAALLSELKLEQYLPQFEEEEMTSIELLEDIVSRGDGEKERWTRSRRWVSRRWAIGRRSWGRWSASCSDAACVRTRLVACAGGTCAPNAPGSAEFVEASDRAHDFSENKMKAQPERRGQHMYV